jgi:DNA invertase Pin-like site-specific DNA recombinase
MAACKKHKTKLVIAKLDRLSRNLAFIAALMESRVEFIAVDNPHATKLTVHNLAAVAQHERELIAQRTRDALRATKARGEKLPATRCCNTACRQRPCYPPKRLYPAGLNFPDDGQDVCGIARRRRPVAFDCTIARRSQLRIAAS